jgi:hypothetical protein
MRPKPSWTTLCRACRANGTGRGRDASYLAPPAQNRTCGFPAYYVVDHIRCVMWRTRLCGIHVRHPCAATKSRFRTPHNNAATAYARSIRRWLVRPILLGVAPSSKYPPAEPGALGGEPLKAAISGDSLPSLTSGALSLDCLEQTIPNPETLSCLRRFARYCGYCRGVLVFVPVHRETPFRVRGGSRLGSFIDGRLP